MYLSRYLLQHVYKWNRPARKRYSGGIAINLDYLVQIEFPYVELSYNQSDVELAVARNKVEMVKLLYTPKREHLFCDKRHYVGLSIVNKYTEMVKFLHESGAGEFTSRNMDCEAWTGNLDMVKWLHENRTEGCTTRAMDLAAANGHLEVVQWLHENRSEGCTMSVMYDAIYLKDLDLVKWLIENRKEIKVDQKCLNLAAEYKSDRIVEFFCETYPHLSVKEALHELVGYSRIDTVKILLNYMKA